MGLSGSTLNTSTPYGISWFYTKIQAGVGRKGAIGFGAQGLTLVYALLLSMLMTLVRSLNHLEPPFTYQKCKYSDNTKFIGFYGNEMS